MGKNQALEGQNFIARLVWFSSFLGKSLGGIIYLIIFIIASVVVSPMLTSSRDSSDYSQSSPQESSSIKLEKFGMGLSVFHDEFVALQSKVTTGEIDKEKFIARLAPLSHIVGAIFINDTCWVGIIIQSSIPSDQVATQLKEIGLRRVNGYGHLINALVPLPLHAASNEPAIFERLQQMSSVCVVTPQPQGLFVPDEGIKAVPRRVMQGERSTESEEDVRKKKSGLANILPSP